MPELLLIAFYIVPYKWMFGAAAVEAAVGLLLMDSIYGLADMSCTENLADFSGGVMETGKIGQ